MNMKKKIEKRGKNNEKNSKKEAKSKGKSKSKMASSSIQQNSNSENDCLEMAIKDRTPAIDIGQEQAIPLRTIIPKIAPTVENARLYQMGMNEPRNLIPGPNFSQHFIPQNMQAPPLINSKNYRQGKSYPNIMQLNSPILNAAGYNMNEPSQRKGIDGISVIPNKISKEQRHPPFGRSCFHVAIAYYIHFTKKRASVNVNNLHLFIYYI